MEGGREREENIVRASRGPRLLKETFFQDAFWVERVLDFI